MTKEEFDRFFSSGRRSHSPFFTLIYTKEISFHGAVVVGKKVYKKAVDRNRMRRQLYNTLYRLSRGNELKGVYIILVKPVAKDVAVDEVRGSLEKAVVSLLK